MKQTLLTFYELTREELAGFSRETEPPKLPKPPKPPKAIIAAAVCVAVTGVAGGFAGGYAFRSNSGGGSVTLQTTEAETAPAETTSATTATTAKTTTSATTTTTAKTTTAATTTTTAVAIPESGNEFEIEQQNGENVLTKYTGDGEKVNIPDGVTIIGDWSFYGCDSIRIIGFPKSVTSIGNHAFDGCQSLENVGNFNTSLTSIGNWAFNNCTSLTYFDAGDVTSIGDYAFSNCQSLKYFVFSYRHNSLTSCSDSAFVGCDNNLTFYNAYSYAIEYAKANNINYTTSPPPDM